jgi:hypothetical protein
MTKFKICIVFKVVLSNQIILFTFNKKINDSNIHIDAICLSIYAYTLTFIN